MAHRNAPLAIAALLLGRLLCGSVATAQAGTSCPANLKGTYGLEEKGTLPVVGQYASAGILSSDGRGSFQGTSTSSYGGAIVQETFSGVYTVNSDCTGTASFTGNVVQGTANRALVILDQGRQIQMIAIDPGQIVTGSLTKTAGE